MNKSIYPLSLLRRNLQLFVCSRHGEIKFNISGTTGKDSKCIVNTKDGNLWCYSQKKPSRGGLLQSWASSEKPTFFLGIFVASFCKMPGMRYFPATRNVLIINLEKFQIFMISYVTFKNIYMTLLWLVIFKLYPLLWINFI